MTKQLVEFERLLIETGNNEYINWTDVVLKASCF